VQPEDPEAAMTLFHNRSEAGRQLAAHLGEFANRTDVMVLALPKGGVPVAAEVASALAAPLDVLVVRKIGVPRNPEFAVGALASGGMMVLDTATMNQLGLTRDNLEPVIRAEQQELVRRERLFRRGRPYPDLEGKVVILVDDGLATGATMQAAVAALRTRRPALVVVAVPVASRSAIVMLQRTVDRVVCVAAPEPFYGVGAWYEDFEQTTDEEVLSLLTPGEILLQK
jgi:putative phosphoribosyl transferase